MAVAGASAERALEKANDELHQFAYAASHDLKAPLRAIACLSEWLEEDLAGALTPRSQEHLRLLRGRVHRLEALLNGLLAYYRASRTDGELQPVDLEPFLRHVVALIAPSPGAVEIAIPAGLPAVIVDTQAFQQVWLRLVGNALEHAPGARITLSARDAGEVWELAVSDDGPGIAPEYHERIFRMFQTLAPRDRTESVGIGLPIVKKLVEERGGRVWVESALGKGATFSFTWPKP
jgi:signal transduction histidine kinase